MNGTDNYSVRFGELCMLHTSFQVISVLFHGNSVRRSLFLSQMSCCKFREDIEIFNLFDLFEEDKFLYDIVKH
ncbi:hypothetical protein Y032_0132g1693 [Ancylostoma ceylanicum]|uniref:Uncharacterized protein n=1 Tax=Ancylostoma ceylanicum TaxID=53326 RepID=A0A016T5M7_9BILA|nr:hypothetical protein Y032_0132g1693 [Ancylostoma ceylanicum]